MHVVYAVEPITEIATATTHHCVEDNPVSLVSVADETTSIQIQMESLVKMSQCSSNINDGVDIVPAIPETAVSALPETAVIESGLEVLLLPLLRPQAHFGVKCRNILQWRYYSW